MLGLLAPGRHGAAARRPDLRARHRDRHRQRRPRRAWAGSRSSSRGSSDDVESWWARVAAPGAGTDCGVMWLPQVNDEVLVGVRARRRPLPVRPRWPVERQGRHPVRLRRAGARRRHGHLLRRSCRGRATRSTSRRPADDSSIQLLTKGGAVEITLDEHERGAEDRGQGQGRCCQADGDVEIKAGGSMKLEATGQMTIKGATVAIN